MSTLPNRACTGQVGGKEDGALMAEIDDGRHYVKKRSRFIVLLIGILIIMGGIWGAKIEWDKAYAVCRNKMLSVEGYGVWKYRKSGLELNLFSESLRPTSGLDFAFEDGTNHASCSVFRDSLGWHKNGEILLLRGRCTGCPEGKFGVSP